MKKLLLLLTILFTFSVNSQIVVMTAVDLKEGAEDEYLKLEKFYAGIHKEAIKQGLRTGWSLWKTAGNEDDPTPVLFKHLWQVLAGKTNTAKDIDLKKI